MSVHREHAESAGGDNDARRRPTKAAMKGASSETKEAFTIQSSVDPAASFGKKRTVKFDTVYRRQYKVHVGDNPAVSSGPALTIHGSFTEFAPLPVDEYESCRGSRKKESELRLSPQERRRRLIDEGYSIKQIQKATAETNRARRRRRRTVANLDKFTHEETFEKFVGHLKKIVLLQFLKKPNETEIWSQEKQGEKINAVATHAA